jgi:signal transduction histidine kinase/CheY-like chemotaxis protein
MSPPAAYPEVPDFLLAQWQELMSLVSVDCGVPAALIMRVHPSQIEVLVSDGSDSPYHPGERENLCTGLYCEHVIATRDRLHVANALTDPNWDHNPDLRLGMISYLGYPLLWPDGVPFGTLCILDRAENHYSEAIDKQLGLARRIIESNLSLINETARHRQTIAALRQSKQHLRDAVLRANAADRAKTDFLARASHDLRAPLTSIIGYAQLLQGCGGTAGQHGQIIRHSADHMLTLINDLVEYASGSLRDEIDARPQRLPEFIERLAHEATMLARRNHNRFVLQRRDGLPGVVWMDARRVQQIVGNLIENAAKFTRQGSIELTVGHSTDGAPAGGVMLQIEVRDTGCGISADDLPRVFEPFFRCGDSRRIEGTGLGLPIVDLWIKRLGGSLQLDSTLGVGTRIRLAIPLKLGSEGDIEARQPHEEALPAPFGGGRRLWVVEDAAETRGQLVDILENAGFVVACAEDGQAFIERIGAADAAAPCLVLTDLMMPGADGHAVCAAVRARWPGVPVVLLSAQAPDAGGTDSAFDARLHKPVAPARLRAALAGLLAPAPAEPPSAPAPRPDAAALARMRALIELGALTDLVEWAEALAAKAPEHDAFARKVLALADRWDVEALQALCN